MVGKPVRRKLACALIALAAVGLGSTVAPAAPLQGVVVVFGSKYYPGDATLSQPTLYISAGSSLLFVNGEDFPNTHTVTSDYCVIGGALTDDCNQALATRLFQSGPVNQLNRADVVGVSTLVAGTYTFFCSIHGHAMRGSLVVV